MVRAAPHRAGLKGCQHTPGAMTALPSQLTKGKLLRSVRGSETIFHPARRALFHRPGLSAALHRMYSSLPCLVVFHCCLSIYTKTEGLSSTNFPAVGRLRSHWMDGCDGEIGGAAGTNIGREGRVTPAVLHTAGRTEAPSQAEQQGQHQAAGAPKRKRMLPWGSAAPARPAKAAGCRKGSPPLNVTP